MSEGLTYKTLRGLLWSLIERGGTQLIHLIISIILARLLLPEEFGLIAILAVFISVSQQFVNAGFSQALIQKQDATIIDESSVFYFNILLSLLMAAILYLIAPFIAEFYGFPLLEPIGRVLSFNVILGAFGIVHVTLLTKHLKFKTQLIISLICTVLSGAIGITLALRGFGVWSLAAQSVSATLTRTVLLWFLHDWRPDWIISIDSLRHMFPFGSRLLLSGLLDTVFRSSYTLIIGKLYSARDLGFYSRAEQIQKIPVHNLAAAVGRVTFPAFASVQKDKARLKRGVRKAVMALALINFPMMIGLAVVAKPLILVLLTEKWLPSLLFLQLFCVLGLLYPLHSINLNVLKAQGRSDLFLRLEIIKKVPLLVAIAITYRWGISAIISGAIVVSFFGYYINAYYTDKLIGYSFSEQLKDIGPTLLIASMMGVCIYPVQYLVSSNQLALLIVQVVLGAALYICFCRLFKLHAFMDAWRALKRRTPIFGRNE